MSHFQIVLLSFLLALLILLAMFFGLAETALMAANRYRLKHKARLKKRYALYSIKMLKRPDRVLGTILIGSTFATMLASSLATLLAFHFWGDKGAFISAILLTFIVLIFAEITPKTLAALYPDKVVKWVAYPIHVLLRVFHPMVWLANVITNGLLKLFHVPLTNKGLEPLSQEELRSVVYDTTGKISRHYQQMLLGILDLNQLSVNDVMVPRHEIYGIDLTLKWEFVLEQMGQLNKEWIPFYRDNVNEMVGVLYSSDLLRLISTNTPLTKERLEQSLQDPYFVPSGTPLHMQLTYFQQNRNKVAFVVNEYGEIEGLVTLNDILEEIVGDFTQTLPFTQRLQPLPDGGYLVDGAMTLREFNRTTDWELPLTGPRTLNGLLIEYLEALPHIGTTVLISHYPIEIIQVKDNRVKLAKIFPRLGETD